LLTKMFELHYLPPFSVSFFQDIWENTKEEFQHTWVATDENDINYLAMLFTHEM